MSRIGDIIVMGFRLLKVDKITVVPYLIFGFAVFFLNTQFPALFSEKLPLSTYVLRYGGVNWAMELFVQAFTIAMLVMVIKHKPVDVSAAFLTALKRLYRLGIATMWPVLPAAISSYYLFKSVKDAGPAAPPEIWALVAIALCLKIALLFVPVLIIGQEMTVFQAMKESVKLIKQHFRLVLLYLTSISMVLVTAQVVSIFMLAIPKVGESIFFVATQGLSFALVTAMSVIFYYRGLTPGTTISASV